MVLKVILFEALTVREEHVLSFLKWFIVDKIWM